MLVICPLFVPASALPTYAFFFFLMMRQPPRSTPLYSSAASDVYKRQVYKAKDENVEYEKELNAELAKLQKTRQKYMDMYTDDLISREELNEKIGGSRQEMERIENELKMVSYHLTKGEQLENILNNTFKEIEDITDVHQMTNQQLKRLIQKIEVDKDGNVDIYLRLLGDLGLDESVLIEENETVLNCNDQT